jgi:CHAT domain-containing protein/tetratricopeptide (TPR) repeat protein
MEKILHGVMACGLLATAMLMPLFVQAQTDKEPEWTPEEKELAEKATKLNREGGQLYGMGKMKEAVQKVAEALEMRRKLYPPERFKDGHPDLANSLNWMGFVLDSLGESAKALTYYEQALAMRQKLYPPERFKDGHADLAHSLSNMGGVLYALRERAKALPYYEQALAMRQKLYPPERFKDGHIDLARSLHGMGVVLNALGEREKALPYYEQGLTMHKKLYPPERFKDGHPDLARSLNNIGVVLHALGEPAKALPYCEQALAMCQKLYPPERFKDGHADLAQSLGQMGDVLHKLGEPAKALPYCEQALAMHQKLYPLERFRDGHPGLAGCLNNMGLVLESLGESGKALPYLEQALAMYRKLGTREMGKTSEAQTLAYGRAQAGTRHGYLSIVVRLSPSAVNYDPLWHTRGGMLPLLQARHQGILAQLAESTAVRKDYDELVTVRQKISRLQSEFPKDETGLKDRDKQLAGLNNDQDRLERKLAAGLPEFKRLQEMAEKGPADLARELPKDAAFVDFIPYWHREKGKWTRVRFVAFVVLPGKDAKFLQLGDAKPIDDAIAAWRKHIDAGENSLAPAMLRELVWEKIAAELPSHTKVVYLCPDDDLARMPFAALPGAKKGTILLEDHAVAVVPSGQWLLEQLLYPPKPSDAPERVLAVGDVAYGKPSGTVKEEYKPLAGTGREMKRVLEAFGPEASEGLTGDAANTETVRTKLKTVRYAHFATHGYFDEKSLTADHERLKKSMETWSFQMQDDQRARLVMPNPAGYVGVVLAGANNPSKADKDSGILTGLNFVDMRLENLRLCVLSACETGLGEFTEGEGVVGLQRAFHAAGCPNVVGSLWKVDDEATAALMTQFYYELRVKKRPPLQALQEAQLTLYRHPERIPALAGSRGKIAQADTVKIGSQTAETTPGATARTTPVKLWAAFILSGRGE